MFKNNCPKHLNAVYEEFLLKFDSYKFYYMCPVAHIFIENRVVHLCTEVCCVLVLDIVLDIRRSEKNVWNVFPTWVGVECMVLITRWSENARLKIGVSWIAEWQITFP